MAGIQKPILDASGQTGKKHALEPPVWKVHQFLAFGSIMGQHIAKIVTLNKIGAHLAESALKQTIRFAQFYRCPALGALMIDE